MECLLLKCSGSWHGSPGVPGAVQSIMGHAEFGKLRTHDKYRGLCSAEQPYYSGGICSSPPPPPNREVFVCLPSLFELHRIQGWVWTQMRVECELNFLGLVIRLGEWAISCLEKHNGLKCLIAGKWLMIFIKRHTGKCPKPTNLGRERSPKILNMCLEGEKRLAWKQSGVDRVSLWLHFLYNESNC